MGLFDKIIKKKTNDIWSDAFSVTPSIYRKPDGSLFGGVALTEGTKTILPRDPQTLNKEDGQPVSEWALFMVSTTHHGILGELDYYDALEKLKPYVLDANENAILVCGLTLEEMVCLL